MVHLVNNFILPQADMIYDCFTIDVSRLRFEIKEAKQFESYVGNTFIAESLTEIIGIPVKIVRRQIRVKVEDIILIARPKKPVNGLLSEDDFDFMRVQCQEQHPF